MTENFIEAQYDITKKSKLKRFYESYKKFIFLSIFLLVTIYASFSFYSFNKEKQKVHLSEKYIQAKIYIEKKNNNEATDLLKEIVYSNDKTYSSLALFLILNENLIEDNNELSVLFDHLLLNNKFEEEIKNLIIYKKALLNSNFSNESSLLEEIKPLLNSDTLWKPHALLLMGDYFLSRKEYTKAKEF